LATHLVAGGSGTPAAGLVLGVHAYRSGKLLLGCGVPYMIVLGGTDVNIDLHESAKGEVIRRVIAQHASAHHGARTLSPQVIRRVIAEAASPQADIIMGNAVSALMAADARGLLDELTVAKGTIVNVTSIAGSRVHPFAGAAYATSKAALASLTREMASDFGPLGIRVNSISPGEIDTAILSPGTEKIVATLPLGRLGRTEEVARAIHFLCTDASSYVTGAELHINGGQHV
jgi:NAD(P)-dependent dehydrogenase (short-subunit alcohol dehydrogenase family)